MSLGTLPNSLAQTTGLLGGIEKVKMEMATGGTWTEFEWSPRPLQLREYALKEFWEIFVDEDPWKLGHEQGDERMGNGR